MSRTSTSGSNRLRTFDVGPSERLVVLAGHDEQDARTVYRGEADGRYAIVPVDTLDPLQRVPGLDELAVGKLSVVGESAGIAATGEQTARLTIGDALVATSQAAGVYGLLWIPKDRQ